MANSKRNFITGKMNKSLDERLVPNGQYIDALNVRLGSTEDSEIGSVENSKGNELLTTVNLGVFGANEYNLSNDAKCIGAFEDGANETIYWFIHDSNQPSISTGKADLIVSFNTKTRASEYHVVSFKNAEDVTNTTLNFNPTYLITEINKVGNLLFFTDNYNPPRKINVNKSYDYPTGLAANDLFSSEDLLLIVKPPHQAPLVTGINNGGSDSFLENEFLCFGYRYKYEDNEYSATSIFTNPVFNTKPFNLSVETNLNEGMVNSFNNATILFNSGNKRVTDIEILFKDSDSSQIKIIESINKKELGYLNNELYNYSFTDNKIFTILSSGEILRLYDNVPLLAKTQTLMGNRIMYGNYVDGYDLNRDGVNTRLDYFTELEQNELGFTEITGETVSNKTYTIDGSVTSKGKIEIPLVNIDSNLKTGSILSFSFRVSESQFSGLPSPDPSTSNQNINMGFSYTLLQDFNSITQLIESNDFQSKIGNTSNIKKTSDTFCLGSTFTDKFNCSLLDSLENNGGVPYSKYKSGITSVDQPILAKVINNTTLELTIVAMSYTTDITNPLPVNSVYEYYNVTNVETFFQTISSPQSLHSNRGYEIGIVYMDDFNRATTALVSLNNTIRIPCSASVTQNKIKLTIPIAQLAPSFATRYKFVIKPDSENYETIYSRFYFTDPSDSHTYFLLEGENIAKVENGDVYTVKKDTAGPLNNCVSATVLEKKSQSNAFIANIDTPSGVYMKMLANNFSTATETNSAILPGQEHAEQNSGGENVFLSYKGFGSFINNAYTPYDIPAGSRITINFNFYRNKRGSGNSCEYRSYKLKKQFTSPAAYDDIIQWWNSENIGDIIDTGEKTPSSINNFYDSDLSTSVSSFKSQASFTTNRYQWFKDSSNDDEIEFLMSGTESCSGSGSDANIRATFEIFRANDIMVFETEPSESLPDVWYEGQDSYPIDKTTGYHLNGGNFASPFDQSQTATQPAKLFLNFSNCYTFGNGVESYTIRDSIKGKAMSLGNRVTTVSEQDYKKAYRSSDITYSGIYNNETNLNRLNEFNLGLLNFKSVEDSFGPINKMFARKTDILVLQEDKISYVLAGKNLLSDASGGNVLTSVPEVLGLQIARAEDFGISDNTESFVAYGADKFFTDAKRGALLQLKGSSASNEQLNVISEYGMRGWFRDLFQDSFNTQKLGGYDPYMNEYVLSSNDVLLPSIVDCIPCGQRQSLILKENSISYCVEAPLTIGDIKIFTEVPVATPVNLTVSWDGIEQINTTINGLGINTFIKNKQTPSKYNVTLTKIGGLDSDFNITSNCPVGSPLKVVDIVLTNNDDATESIHHNWRYFGGVGESSSPDQIVDFNNNPSDIITSSFYQISDGFEGEGSIPIKGNTLTMISNTYSNDNYSIESSDRFMYLASNILFGNNSTDLRAMLSLIKTQAPTTTLIPSTQGITSSATFAVPIASYDYLYLVWDLRLKPLSLICQKTGVQDAANLQGVCCDCECLATNTKYQILNNSQTTITISYINTSGTLSTENLAGGSRAAIVCSQTYPNISPSTNDVSITVTDCNCS